MPLPALAWLTPPDGAALPWALLACGLPVLALLGLTPRLLHLLRLRHRLRARRLQTADTQLPTLRSPDPLTGLMTRADFERAFDEAVLAGLHDAEPLAVLHIGLDNFRALNDANGHGVGDTVLALAADRLRQAVGPPLALARLGGDEFALLVGADADEAADAAEHLVKTLQMGYTVERLRLRVGASIGIALYPDHGSRPRLLGLAALAMHAVKAVGGGGHSFYDPALAVDWRAKADLLQALRLALEQGQLQLVYQPQVDARHLEITAAEALLRWQHPQRGTLSPAVFVPLAEQHGLMGAIGRWVVEQACEQAAQWRSLGLHMRVAVKLSGAQMRQDGVVEHIAATLQQHGLAPAQLSCEISEAVATEDSRAHSATFDRLGALGVPVCIDDFAGAAGSLARLRKLPVAAVKLDRGLVAELVHSADARATVASTIAAAHTLALRVVAVGVETEAQRELLVAMGCDELQGFLFARPMNAAALSRWADQASLADTGGRVNFRASLDGPAAPLHSR